MAIAAIAPAKSANKAQGTVYRVFLIPTLP